MCNKKKAAVFAAAFDDRYMVFLRFQTQSTFTE